MKRITDDKILAIGNSTNSCVFAAQLSADAQLAADLKSFRELVEKVEEEAQLHLDIGDVSPSYIKYFNQGIVKGCRAILSQLPPEQEGK